MRGSNLKAGEMYLALSYGDSCRLCIPLIVAKVEEVQTYSHSGPSIWKITDEKPRGSVLCVVSDQIWGYEFDDARWKGQEIEEHFGKIEQLAQFVASNDTMRFEAGKKYTIADVTNENHARLREWAQERGENQRVGARVMLVALGQIKGPWSQAFAANRQAWVEARNKVLLEQQKVEPAYQDDLALVEAVKRRCPSSMITTTKKQFRSVPLDVWGYEGCKLGELKYPLEPPREIGIDRESLWALLAQAGEIVPSPARQGD